MAQVLLVRERSRECIPSRKKNREPRPHPLVGRSEGLVGRSVPASWTRETCRRQLVGNEGLLGLDGGFQGAPGRDNTRQAFAVRR